MFTRLSLDVRLLIWETILSQPRVVFLNMRRIPNSSWGNGMYDRTYEHADNPSAWLKFECVSSTPVPVLLHLCSETRAIALRYYDLTFGSPAHVAYDPDGSELHYTQCEPRTYFNFRNDTVVFGTPPKPGQRSTSDNLPFHDHFAIETLNKIERLGVGIYRSNWGTFSRRVALGWLNRQAELGNFPKLKKLYMYVVDDKLDPWQELELFDLTKECGGETKEELAEVMVKIWQRIIKRDLALDKDIGGLRYIRCNGLSREPGLASLLLKNGSKPEEVLDYVWLKNVKEPAT